MKYVLDTNTVSFLMRGDARVRERLRSLSRTDVLLSQPVVAEIEYGLARLPRSARKSRLLRRFELFLKEFDPFLQSGADLFQFFICRPVTQLRCFYMQNCPKTVNFQANRMKKPDCQTDSQAYKA